MTVSSKVSSIIYVGDNLTTVFDVPFRFLEDSDLQLSIQATDGTVTNLVLNSDYTVTGANADNGGKVNLTHPVGNQAKLSILRIMDLLQETDYRENERFPAESHERALDKLTMEVQQLQEQSDRAIKVGVFSDVDPAEIIYEIEELYDIKDSVITAANISSEIVTCSENIEAIQNAPNQATSAATSAQNAEGYASSAHIDAGAAENSAHLAQQWATKMDGQVESTDYSSKYYAGQASASAQAAQDALDNVHGLIATPIGTIFMSIYVDESLDIARRLNGQLISSTKFTGFRTWLNDVRTAFPSLFTTETNWQAEKTNSKLGQCGKFVIDDDAGTIRLPCVVNAQGLTDLQYLGTIKNESLPNISGVGGIVDNTSVPLNGAFESAGLSNNFGLTGITGRTCTTQIFNASRSSSTYQDGAPVQQEAVQYPYYIQVATGIQETLPAIREYKVNNSDFFGKSMYSDVAPDNASWLVSNGQWNAKSVYPDYYNWLLERANAGDEGFKGKGFNWITSEKNYTCWTSTENIHVGVTVYGYPPNMRAIGNVETITDTGFTFTDKVNGLSVTVVRGNQAEDPTVSSPDWITDYDWAINTSDETFRLPLLDGSEDLPSGRYENLTLASTSQRFIAPANGIYTVSGIGFGLVDIANETSGAFGSCSQPRTSDGYGRYTLEAKRGDQIVIYCGAIPSSYICRFIYAQGNGSLYYYVGDTVQDASLINAGAVLGQLANKADANLSNLDATGQAKFDAKANVDLSNLNNTGNAAASNLNSKGIRTVIETYVNGTSWYRLFSDGFIEQGGSQILPVGTTTITLLFPVNILSANGIRATINHTTPESNPLIGILEDGAKIQINTGSGASEYFFWKVEGFKR